MKKFSSILVLGFLLLLLVSIIVGEGEQGENVENSNNNNNNNDEGVYPHGYYPEVVDAKGVRIVGGTGADWFDNYPYLLKNVCLYNGTTVWVVCGCSSTLIGFRWAVTAAHCLNGPYTYRVGVMFSDGEVVEILPGNEFRHPDFSRDSLHLKLVIGIVSESRNDVGLQRLSRMATPRPGVQIFNILYLYLNPNLLNANIVGLEAKLLGWGATTQAQVFEPPPEGFSNTLMQIDEIVQANAACQAVLDYIAVTVLGLTESPFRFDDTLLCATPVGLTLGVIPEPNPAGLCNGDSGGPLLTNRNRVFFNRLEILGFVTDTLSTEQDFCGNGLDIYTRFTPDTLTFIQSVILQNSF